MDPSRPLPKRTAQAMNCLPRMRCTLRNILWINEYWQCRQPAEVSPLQGSSGAEEEEIVWDRDGSCPNPIAETYGFSATNKGKVKWWDEHVKA